MGAGGGVGSFAAQFAANAGGHVIANARGRDAERMRAYGGPNRPITQRSRCETRSAEHTRTALMSSST